VSHRWAPYALLVLLAVLPLQWLTLGSFGLHNLALFPACALSVGAVPTSTRRWYLGWARSFLVAATLLCGLLALLAWYWGANPVAPSRTWVYIVTALLVTRIVAAATADPGRYDRQIRVLGWSAPVTVAVYLVFFYRSMTRAGVSISMLVDGLVRGDPAVIEQVVYRSAFNEAITVSSSDPSFVASNLRHEIMAALLLAAGVTLWALLVRSWPYRSRVVFALSCVSVGMIVMLSMSRAVTIGLVGPAVLLLGARTVWRASGSALMWIFLGVLPITVIVLVFTPYADLVYQRFFVETASYGARSGATRDALERLVSSPSALLMGGEQLTGRASSHNMVIDSWSAAGVSGAVSAVAVLVVLLRKWLAVAYQFIAAERLDALLYVILMTGALPFVRAFSGGAGLLHFVQWMLVGFFLATSGGLAVRHSRSATRVGVGHEHSLSDPADRRA
jgi:hypothetical protein